MRTHWLSEGVNAKSKTGLDHHVQLPSVNNNGKPSSCTISILMMELEPGEGRLNFRAGKKKQWAFLVQDGCMCRPSAGTSATRDRRTPTFQEWDLEEDEFDEELSGYRGLVLDVSYRCVNFVQHRLIKSKDSHCMFSGGGMHCTRRAAGIHSSNSYMKGTIETCNLVQRPINVVCWKRALCLEILDKAEALEYYDYVIKSPSRSFPIPAVLRVTDYTHVTKKAKVKLLLNRKNVFLRDKFRCQYCNAREKLTVDHVVPLSRGGEWTWKNLVTACAACNTKKGGKTLEEANMKLLKQPKEPSALDSREMAAPPSLRSIGCTKSMPVKWLDYLPKHLFNPLKAFD